MPRVVHLVRHGEVANPRGLVYASLPGFGLSPAGRTQARATAAHLTARPIRRVVCSPLQRALETATPIAASHHLEPEVDERLTESGMTERWAGVRWSELSQLFPGELEAYLLHPETLPHAPESLEESGGRVIEAMDEAGEGEAVFVSHQDPIQAARRLIAFGAIRDFHIDKPGHASAVTMIKESRWRQAGYWEPHIDGAPTFPSIDP